MKKFVVFVAAMLVTACLIVLSGLAFPTVVALLVLVSAISLDFYTTWRCLKEQGKEGNPAVAFLFRKVGVGKTFCLMAAFWTMFIMFRWIHQTESIQTAVAIVYWVVPLNNMIVLAKLMKKNHAC